MFRLCWGARASSVTWLIAYSLLACALPGSAIAMYLDYGHEYRSIGLSAVAMVTVAVVMFAVVGWRMGWLQEAVADYRAHKGEWVRADSPLGRVRDGPQEREEQETVS